MIPALVSDASLAADTKTPARARSTLPDSRVSRPDRNRMLASCRHRARRHDASARTRARPAGEQSADRAGYVPALPRTPSVPNRPGHVTPDLGSSCRLLSRVDAHHRLSPAGHDAHRQLEMTGRRSPLDVDRCVERLPSLRPRFPRPAHVHVSVRGVDLHGTRRVPRPAQRSLSTVHSTGAAATVTTTRAVWGVRSRTDGSATPTVTISVIGPDAADR